MKISLFASIAISTFAAVAVDITTDTTVTLAADSSEDYAVAENVTLTFEVTGSTARIHSGTISGLGKVKKTGAGPLILSGNNTFEGGFEQAEGTVRADSSTAFGTGDVTCSVPATGKQLIFNVANAVFLNNFNMTGAGTSGSSKTPFMEFRTPTTINGNVTLIKESWESDYAAGNEVIINGSFGKTGGCGLIWNTLGNTHFKGPLTLGNFYIGNVDSQKGTNHLWSTANSIKYSIIFQQGSVICHAENVMSGAKLAFRGSASTSVSVLDMNGLSQTIKSMTIYNNQSVFPTASTSGLKVYSAIPATLTMTGAGANTTETGYFALSGQVSLLLNAASTFKQIFARRVSDTTGSIEVRSGILEMTETATFKRVSNITVAEGMSFLMNSTASLALENVPHMTVNGTFSVGESSTMPFGYGTLALELGPNAQMSLPADSVLTVYSLKVDGADVTGEVTAGQYGLVSGKIRVKGPDTSDAWTGNGASQSIALAENWQSTETPNLYGGLAATFSAADATGFTTDVDRNVFFRSMNLDTTADFTFTGRGTITVDGGITAATPAQGNTPMYNFQSPVSLMFTQTLNFPANTKMRLAGGSSFGSSVTLYREGEGDFIVSGSNVWDGAAIVHDCDVYLSGTITSSAGIDETVLDKAVSKTDTENAIYLHMSKADYKTVTRKSTRDSSCTISNAVIERPLQIRTANISAFNCSPGTTNYFKSYFLSADASSNGLKMPSDAEVYFDGGAAFIWSFYLNSGGTVYFRNKPITTTNSGYGLAVTGGTKAVFEVGGNTIKAMAIAGGTFDFRADDVVGTAGNLLMDANNSVLHLNSTSQRMGTFSNHVARANSYIDGDGATLSITNNAANRHSWIRIPFNGDVSLKVNTPSQVWLDNATSPSTGSIAVERGTLEFRSGASWTNVSEVAVSGTGTLKILAASGVTARLAFGKKADVRLSDDGVISLPDGAAVWVKHLYVNGVQQPKGAYRYDTIQDAAVKAHFDPESTGTLLVRGDGGFSLSIR